MPIQRENILFQDIIKIVKQIIKHGNNNYNVTGEAVESYSNISMNDYKRLGPKRIIILNNL